MSGVNSKFHAVPVNNVRNNVALDVPSESTPCIFKMNVDCFEKLFEWLSVEDLKTLRQTCKRIKRVINYYIKMHFPQSLQRIRIIPDRLEYCRCSEITDFELVKKVEFNVNNFTMAQIDGLRPMLARVECLSIGCPFINIDFYDIFLKHCMQLRRLQLYGQSVRALFVNGKSWLHQRYPTLEFIGIEDWLEPGGAVECSDFKIFFTQNSSIQHFKASARFFWSNRNWIQTSNIKIQQLDITHWNMSSGLGFQLIALLNDLHEHGFYQRLHISLDLWQKHVSSIHSVRGLVGLFENSSPRGDLPCLGNLKELSASMCRNVSDSEMLSTNLPNLRRITIHIVAVLGFILPFIHRCPKLTQIRIYVIKSDDVFFKSGIIDLSSLNEERGKLVSPRKVTIFVHEEIFLANKWKQNINLEFVELKRIHCWNETHPLFG